MAGEAEVVENEDKEFQDAFDAAADDKEGTDSSAVDAADKDEEKPGDAAPAAKSADDSAAAAEAEPEVDPYEGMDEVTKARFQNIEKTNEDLQHRIDSDNGRVGAFQKKVNNLEHQIAGMTHKPDQPSMEAITEAMGTDEGWTKFSEDYPEVSAAIDGRLDNFGKSVGENINSRLAPVINKQNENAQEASYGEVAETFPTWQDAVNTPEFSDWMATQSPGIQALAGSDDTSDASSLIGMFDDYRVTQGDESLRIDPSPDNDGNSVDNTATDLAAKRARQLEDGVAIESKTARIDPNAESGTEFENAFNAFASRKEANRA